MQPEFPWLPSDRCEVWFVTFSLGGPTAVPRSFVHAAGAAFWSHAALRGEVRSDTLHCDSWMPSGGTQSLASASAGIKPGLTPPGMKSGEVKVVALTWVQAIWTVRGPRRETPRSLCRHARCR